MKDSTVTMFAAILVLGALVAPRILAGRTETVAQDSERKSKPLIWVLIRMCADYDCFCTIEGGWQEGEVGNKLETEWTQRSLEKGGLVQELEELRRTVPFFSYQFDVANPRIVHIIDTRLMQQTGYALELSIKSLEFSGKLRDLPNAIGKGGIPISAALAQGTDEQWDASTEVQIKEDGLSVRGALSDFVELDGRDSRILWIARTKLEQGAVTYVFYRWPGKMSKQ